MKRRSFVAKLSSIGLLAGLPGLHALHSLAGDRFIPVLPELLNVLGSHQAVREIGKTYLQSQHDSPSMLLSRLFRKFEAVGSISEVDTKDRILEDFSTGDTVKVNGWILSSTEAQCCALAYLRHV